MMKDGTSQKGKFVMDKRIKDDHVSVDYSKIEKFFQESWMTEVYTPIEANMVLYKRAQELILAQMDKLHAVAQKLLEKETITAEEFQKIFDK